MQPNRCAWVNTDELYIHYHDTEWGVPCYDDQKLFEMILLEGFQAGLSWITVLKKRENYRQALRNFDPHYCMQLSDFDLEVLMQNTGIIRNKLKVKAIRTNALAYLKIKESGISFSDFLWKFINHKPQVGQWKTIKDVPVSTPISNQMSIALKKAGFTFVGSTICYAFMQATGMVNDHTQDCFKVKK